MSPADPELITFSILGTGGLEIVVRMLTHSLWHACIMNEEVKPSRNHCFMKLTIGICMIVTIVWEF